mmetsp:Transcript_4051/g.6717  ORF Transcript_4051/g.6717 Transcript_4051/m.6717 type:complete len:87 (-) Transcript_4051:1130-1390(-)
MEQVNISQSLLHCCQPCFEDDPTLLQNGITPEIATFARATQQGKQAQCSASTREACDTESEVLLSGVLSLRPRTLACFDPLTRVVV